MQGAHHFEASCQALQKGRLGSNVNGFPHTQNMLAHQEAQLHVMATDMPLCHAYVQDGMHARNPALVADLACYQLVSVADDKLRPKKCNPCMQHNLQSHLFKYEVQNLLRRRSAWKPALEKPWLMHTDSLTCNVSCSCETDGPLQSLQLCKALPAPRGGQSL